jgi:hypothetical protein
MGANFGVAQGPMVSGSPAPAGVLKLTMNWLAADPVGAATVSVALIAIVGVKPGPGLSVIA